MPDAKPKYANFPERELKVLIGANINASTTKSLTRFTIGTYEMSFTQQEKGKQTCDAVKTALNHLAKAQGLTVASETSREFVGSFTARSENCTYAVWVCTPFELTQAGHLIWVKYHEAAADGAAKVGVAFKIATAYSIGDIENLLKTAQKAAIALPADEPFTLKGNPPPRFQKKVPAGEAPATEAAAEPSAETAPQA